jgi:hypothetical protein
LKLEGGLLMSVHEAGGFAKLMAAKQCWHRQNNRFSGISQGYLTKMEDKRANAQSISAKFRKRRRRLTSFAPSALSSLRLCVKEYFSQRRKVKAEGAQG